MALLDGIDEDGDSVELVGIADRALVMREGRIVGEVSATSEARIDQEDIMTLSTGSAPATAPERSEA